MVTGRKLALTQLAKGGRGRNITTRRLWAAWILASGGCGGMRGAIYRPTVRRVGIFLCVAVLAAGGRMPAATNLYIFAHLFL
jgi:hypothetical protein